MAKKYEVYWRRTAVSAGHIIGEYRMQIAGAAEGETPKGCEAILLRRDSNDNTWELYNGADLIDAGKNIIPMPEAVVIAIRELLPGTRPRLFSRDGTAR